MLWDTNWRKPEWLLGGGAAVVAALLLVGVGGRADGAKPKPVAVAQIAEEALDLSPRQVESLKIAPVEYREFQPVQSALGIINFNENMLVQVFPQYAGKIIRANFSIGDEVRRGDPLFVIDSPDLLQAQSTLLSSAGVLQLQNRALARTRDLVKAGGAAQKDLDQATSDQQTAEGNYKAAKDAVRLFGKTNDEIERTLSERKIDSSLVVVSPVSGRIVARSASPGLLVQPGSATPPFIVADVSMMWMVANITESEVASIRLGQQVEASVPAYPGRKFSGRISSVGLSIDPNTHRQTVRSEIDDPDHLLRSGMLADFSIRTGEAVSSIALPTDAVVREGDGSMTVWTTQDRKRFAKRQVQVGMRSNGWTQILSGVEANDLIVTEGGIFLTNKLLTAAGT
jgi:cobalt-zinc-cadmium efflux system membrane fusion protein